MTNHFLWLFASSVLLSAATSPAAAQVASKGPAKASQARAGAAVSAAAATPVNEATIATRADALTASMTQGLGLTPAQVEKVRVINASSVRSVETARQRYRQDPTKLRGYIEDIGEARIEKLKDVLTPAQFGRYQQKREEKMGIPTVRGNQGNPPPGLGSGE